jgi:hypothetical protein
MFSQEKTIRSDTATLPEKEFHHVLCEWITPESPNNSRLANTQSWM